MKSNWRTVLSLFVALVFSIAAIPGSMAMPAPKASSAPMAAMHHCDHMQMMKAGHDCAQHKTKEQGSPCKNMAACMGVLGCFGVVAIDFVQVHAFVPARGAAVAITHQSVQGLSLRPDNPPPIA